MWRTDGLLVFDGPLERGKLHGEVYWRLLIDDPSEFAPRMKMEKALGLPDGPAGTQRSTLQHGVLTRARFYKLESEPPCLEVNLRDGKLHGDVTWQVGPIEDPIFEWNDVKLEARKTFKVPKPWPKRAVATFAQGALVGTAFFDAEGNPVGPAPGPLTAWGEKTTVRALGDYVSGGAFAAEVAAFFPKTKGLALELPRKSAKLVELPAANRASAQAFDRLVRAKKVPFMGSFDLTGYGFDCVENRLEGAADPKFFGLAYDGNADLWLLDVSTGEVVRYEHESAVLSKQRFVSVDQFAFAMLRLELAVSGRIRREALKKTLVRLGLKAALPLLRPR